MAHIYAAGKLRGILTAPFSAPSSETVTPAQVSFNADSAIPQGKVREKPNTVL